MTQSRRYLSNLNVGLGIPKSDITYIHRGRNRYLTKYFIRSCSSDYNYDFRGLPKGSALNLIVHFSKSFLTSLEVKKNRVFLFEGGLHILIAFFLMVRHKKAIYILNIADPTLYQKDTSWRGELKKALKNFLIRRFDIIITNSPMIYDDAIQLFKSRGQVYCYRLPIFDRKITIIPDIVSTKSILFLITRPSETGYIKGLHIFKQIVEKFYLLDKTITFIIGGSGSEELEFSTPNVTAYGHFESVDEAYRRANVLLCPSTYDAYPCVSLESLRFGVLPVVSVGCGSASDLSLIYENLVVERQDDIEEWADKILKVLNISPHDMLQIKRGAVTLLNGFVE